MAKRIITPFAEQGDKDIIPESPVGLDVNWQTGYPQSYEEDPGTPENPNLDARFVERDKTNQLLNDITANIKEWQEHTYPAFITADNNGGAAFPYKEGAIVTYNGVDYISLIDNNTTLPTSSDWIVYIPEKSQQALKLKIFQSPTDNLTKVTTFAGGVGVVYEVRKTSDNSLATIYSDKDVVTSIPQNGTANVSNGDAEAVFYIADGDYTVTINAVSAIFSAGAKHFRGTTSDVSAGLYDAGSLVILSDRDEGVFEVVSGGTANGANILNAGGGNTATLVSDIVTVGMFGGDKAAAVSYVNNKPSLLMIGKNYFTKGSANNTLIKVAEDGTATRVHIEPNGYIQTGTTSKLDLMFDDYEQDPVNYRIAAMFAETGDMPHLYGENGRAVLNIKGTGQQWGVWPSWGLGFQDGTRVPMKAFLYDTSDTEWRTPQKGMWRTSVGYALGDYVLSEFKLYKATNSGTSGASAPTHASGTVSDGVISWEFIRNYQSTVASHDTCVLFGSVDDMPLFGQFDIPVQYHGHTVHKNGFRDKWLKNDGTSLLAWAGVRSDSNSYQIEMSDSSTFQFFEGWYRSTGMAESLWPEIENTNSATVDVSKLQKVVMSNTAATTVTGFTNARAHQSLYVESTNGNTTIQHNSNIRLKGAVDATLGTDSMLHFVRHSDGRFIQV